MDIKDTRLYRSFELHSDHPLVASCKFTKAKKIQINRQNRWEIDRKISETFDAEYEQSGFKNKILEVAGACWTEGRDKKKKNSEANKL